MRVFGLDIGTTSIGFAVVDLDEAHDQGRIVSAPGCPGLGVRIFPEAREPDGTPLNQQRRAKRMMRRQLRRRKLRRRTINELLAANGLLPLLGGKEWADCMTADPYALRAKGLIEELKPHELGRALYHLSKRRHFRERDLAESGEDVGAPQDGNAADGTSRKKPRAQPKRDAGDGETEAAQARAHFVAELKATGQTLGQALAARPEHARRRGEHATRAIVEAEFRGLIEAQAPYHPILRNSANREAIEAAIFAQRPVFWRKSTLGTCPLAPDAPLSPKGSWLSQQRRMFEKVNNLSIAGGNARPLDAEERAAICSALATQYSMSWGGVRKVLKPIWKRRGESEIAKFNHEVNDGDSGLKGNIVEAALVKIFGDAWESHPRKQSLRDFIPDALWNADYDEIGTQRVVIRGERNRAEKRAAIVGRLVQEFGATHEQADALVKLHFPQGWEPYSIEALEKFLPELEKGVRFGSLLNSPEWAVWRNENFPDREQPTGEFLNSLPSPRADKRAKPEQREEAERIAALRNPTVVRVQNELRKVVNNLIRVYGKPDMIRVELAREVGKSKREREEITAGIRRNERKRKAARDDLVSKGIAAPSRDDIEKWMLWRETQERCPYTGDQIGFDDLFRSGRYQVEHIWPRSRSLDDSFRNKTLCREDVNKDKGNRTPCEYFKAKDAGLWSAVTERVWKFVGRDGMSPGKAKRFVADKMPDDFTNRQFTDTAYAARQAIAFLKRLWPDVGPSAPVTVQSVTGRVTAQLRRRWGLNNILSDDGEKTRADHRHHAIDALVVACAHGGYVKRLSDWFAAAERHEKPHLPEPWPTIRHDAEAAANAIVVSHRVRKKVSGPLHLDTTYGDTGEDVVEGRKAYRLFVTRKPVERLTKGEIERIVDDRARMSVANWVSDHGGDPKKAFASFPLMSEGGPEIRRVRLRTKQQLSLMAEISTGYADLGSNHHLAIYRLADGQIDFEVVSLFETARRLAKKEPIVRRDRYGVGSIFLMSLATGDALYFPAGKMEGYWIVQGVWAAGPIVLRRALDATGDSVVRPNAASIIRAGARKVSIDPIGRVRPAND